MSAAPVLRDGSATVAASMPPATSWSIEGVAQVLIMLTIGAAAGAASFTHVHDVAAAHGQTGWLAWADAVVLELVMSIASGVELRRRKRCHAPVHFPTAVMVTAVVLSLSAQVIQAEQTAVGWVAAAIPALGFLVMVKVALAHAAVPPVELLTPPERPDFAADYGRGSGSSSATSTTALELRSAASSFGTASPKLNSSSSGEAGDTKQAPTRGRPANDPAVVALLEGCKHGIPSVGSRVRRRCTVAGAGIGSGWVG